MPLRASPPTCETSTAWGWHAADPEEVARPHVELPSDKVQPIALVLHELATSAAKYGAINQPSGRLSMSWRRERRGDGTGALVLEWRESGVRMPAVPPAHRGCGSKLINRALPFQMDAETRRRFMPDGLVCVILLPLGSFLPQEGLG